MRFLLDTDVVSELRYPADRIDERVRRWSAASPSADHALSAITVMELEIGVMRVERRDRRQGRSLRAWLDGVLDEFAARILSVDPAVARRAAALHVPDPRPASDALIAATALHHGLTVVTRNVADFAPTGVAVLDPWSGRADA